MQVVAFSAPLLIGSGAKVTYDVLLYKSFRRFKAPEGKPAPTTEGIKPGLSQLLVPKKGIFQAHFLQVTAKPILSDNSQCPCGFQAHSQLPV